MPLPSEMPQYRQPPPPQSNLERVFGFSNPHFHDYMMMRGTRRLGPERLLEWSQGMADHENPIVQYAGGWAAAEVAMHRRGEMSVSARLAALELARTAWLSAGVGFAAMRHRNLTFRRQADYFGFELRATQALAYMPTMTIAAELMSGARMDEAAIEEKTKQTMENLLRLGKLSRDYASSQTGINNTNRGFLSEIVTGLLMQSDRPMLVLILPASLRQDNNKGENLRADLLAISIDRSRPRASRYPKKLIQVTGGQVQPENLITDRRVVVQAYTDLVYGDGKSPVDTFSAFAAREAGTLQNPVIDARLNVLARVLTRRVARTA